MVSSRRPVIQGHRHGSALCVVEVVGCRRMVPADVPFACIRDFYPDHYAWELGTVRLIEPFAVLGQLRLFDVADALVRDPAQPSSSSAGSDGAPPPFMAGTSTGRPLGPAKRASGKP